MLHAIISSLTARTCPCFFLELSSVRLKKCFTLVQVLVESGPNTDTQPCIYHDDIPADSLDDAVVSEGDIQRIAQKFKWKWKELSPALGLTEQDEEEIQNGHEQKQQTLRKWKKQQKSEATYRALIDAAEKTHNKKLEDGVKYMRKTPEGNEHYLHLVAH